jgi:HlyD family secretion protein
MRTIITSLILLGAAAGSVAYYVGHTAADAVTQFRKVAIQRGDLLATISATGTLEAEDIVDVGAQVAGLITGFGKDPQGHLIDYNSVVAEGTELAYIDKTSYEAALDQAEAALDKSKADLLQLEAKAEQAEQEWKRAESLRPSKAIADTDYDTALANFKSAKANMAVGKATIQQNQAAVRMAQVNLNYTTIKSPVRGTIVDRRVNIGQTVVASLSAPSLFLIAKDLRRMQVWASVNEADIGQIKLGMPVRFTVDAYPSDTFHGKVSQVRMNATMTQNVVTYTVIVTTDNPDGKLLPYLTSNVQFELSQRSNVLLVPNAALRWKPQASQISPANSKSVSSSVESADAPDRGHLWVTSDGGLVRPIEVLLGASDAAMTEISGSDVKEGMQVIASADETENADDQEAGATAAGEKTTNPFLPKPPKGSRPPPGPM